MNNKGIFAVEAAFLGTLVIALSFLPSQTPAFRKNLAVNVCVNHHNTQEYCEDKVASMSTEQILYYVKDDKVSVSQNNNGNFVNGYMN